MEGLIILIFVFTILLTLIYSFLWDLRVIFTPSEVGIFPLLGWKKTWNQVVYASEGYLEYRYNIWSIKHTCSNKQTTSFYCYKCTAKFKNHWLQGLT
jgi:hypothetical protein